MKNFKSHTKMYSKRINQNVKPKTINFLGREKKNTQRNRKSSQTLIGKDVLHRTSKAQNKTKMVKWTSKNKA